MSAPNQHRMPKAWRFALPSRAIGWNHPGNAGQVSSPPGQDGGAQQERFHRGGEDPIAGLDGILAVAQLMSEPDPPGLPMAALPAVKIRAQMAGV